MSQHRESVAPIFRVPPEILAEIFVTASEDSAIHHLTDSKPPISSTISFVCRHWRAVSIDFPSLWRAISFNSSDNPARDLPAVLELYLTRSRGAPLFIQGTLLRESDTPSLNVLLRHSHRWQEMRLHLDFIFIPILNAVMHRVPLLEQLSLSIAHTPDAPRWLDEDITAFLSAPSLHEVSACDLTLRHAFLPQDQITSLTATEADLRFTLLLARTYENLTHFSLQGWDRPAGFNTVIELPKLHSLCVIQDRKSFGSPLHHLFELLDIPQLTSLHIEGSHDSSEALEWNTDSFVHMTTRHAPSPFPLVSLSLSNVAMSEQDLLMSLHSLPLLETLSLTEGAESGRLAISNSFLRGMTWPCSVAPHLKSLRLAGRGQFSAGCLADLQQSRTSRVAELSYSEPGLTTLGRAKLDSVSLTLVTSLEKASVLMNRLLLLDKELPLGVDLGVRERVGGGGCGYCRP